MTERGQSGTSIRKMVAGASALTVSLDFLAGLTAEPQEDGPSTIKRTRDRIRLRYGLGVLNQDGLQFQLSVDTQLEESPMLGGAANGVLGRATVSW